MDVDDFLLAVDGHGASDIVADGIMQHKGLWQKAQNQCSSPGFHLQQAQQRPRLSAHVNTKFLENPVLLGFVFTAPWSSLRRLLRWRSVIKQAGENLHGTSQPFWAAGTGWRLLQSPNV